MRNRCLRRLAAVALAGGLCLPAGTAGAEPADLGWWLTAYGSAHCILDQADGYHVVCARYNYFGYFSGYVIDDWLPAFCAWAGSESGDASGSTLRLRFYSPDPSRACMPVGSGWGDGSYVGGFRYQEGVASHDASYVTARSVQVFGRDPAWPWVYGALLEVW